jgi:transcriptional regulator with XRE-family HTH domain
MTGRILKLLRNANGLTQIQLSNLIGCSAQYVSAMESGKAPVTENVQRKLRLAISVDRTLGDVIQEVQNCGR